MRHHTEVPRHQARGNESKTRGCNWKERLRRGLQIQNENHTAVKDRELVRVAVSVSPHLQRVGKDRWQSYNSEKVRIE